MAADAESLNLILAVETHKELLAIVDQERKLRKNLLSYVSKNESRLIDWQYCQYILQIRPTQAYSWQNLLPEMDDIMLRFCSFILRSAELL